MPEIIIPGPEGRLRARYQKGKNQKSPICSYYILILDKEAL